MAHERNRAAWESATRPSRRMRDACICVAFLLSLLGVERASAAEITFQWYGTVSFVDPSYSGVLSPLGIVVGAPMRGSYTFESTTADTAPGDPDLGEYTGAIVAWEMSLGHLDFSLDAGGSVNEISVVLDTSEHFYNPAASVNESPATAGLPPNLTGDVLLLDVSKTVITDDSLPLSPPQLPDFTAALVGIFDEDTALVVIDADMTLLWDANAVPGLSTPALLMLAALLVAAGVGLQRTVLQPR